MLLEERAYLCERDAPAHDKTHQCVGNLFNPGELALCWFLSLMQGQLSASNVQQTDGGGRHAMNGRDGYC
jgi:hypothetical protein